MKNLIPHSSACALTAALAFSITLLCASPCWAQSGKGANSGGAANTAEGTGRGAGGPGDGEGPGQGAGQGLGPGGKKASTKGSPTAAKQDTTQKGGGANSGGAANTVEGTGRGAGGPGDGEGPGQGAGQGLGPGGKKGDQKNKPEREKPQRPEKKKDEHEKPGKPERPKDDRDQPVKPERPEKKQDDRENPPKEQPTPKEEKPSGAIENRDQPPKEQPVPKEEKPKQDVPPREKDERDQPGKPEDKPAPQREPQPAKPEGEPGKPPQPAPAKDKDPAPEPPRKLDVPGEKIPSTRDLPVSPADSRVIPGVPARDIVPQPGNIPGVAQVDQITRNIPGISNARNGFFGFLFGGKKAAGSAAAAVVSDGKQVIALEKAQRINRARGAFLGIYRIEIPNLFAAAKVDKVMIDPRVTSPRTVTYKSRLSRISRWIGPLTMGLINYIPFETMNDAMSARLNNLMADEEISVEKLVAASFAQGIKDGKRFKVADHAGAVLEAEVTRYALDPMPTSLGRMKPTVSVTGRMFDGSGQLLWLGKGFSTIVEPGIKGATVEQYEDNPAMLRADFEKAARVAVSRLAAQANALPKASVKVVAADR